jgi:hypothetical protein
VFLCIRGSDSLDMFLVKRDRYIEYMQQPVGILSIVGGKVISYFWRLNYYSTIIISKFAASLTTLPIMDPETEVSNDFSSLTGTPNLSKKEKKPLGL